MRGGLIRWAPALVVAAFAAAEALTLNARIRDFDEGVYWQSLRAMADGEPLFSSVYASQPPAFYYLLLPLYLVGRSLASLRLTILLVGVIGLLATYLAARLLAGRISALVALLLVATSPLYFHQSAIVQADGPAVSLGMAGLCLALLAVRRRSKWGLALAGAAGLLLALAIGVKFIAALMALPVAIALAADTRRWSHLGAAAIGGLLGLIIVLSPAIRSPGAAFDQLVVVHLRAGAMSQQTLLGNARRILLRRELPLEGLGMLGAAVGIVQRNRQIVMPVVWAAAILLVVLVYHPLFPHHLVLLSVPLALAAAVGLRSTGGRVAGEIPRPGLPPAAVAVLVLATAAAGAVAIGGEVRAAMVPDRHDSELATAVARLSRPSEYWISDNPYAVALAGRSLPGPLVDTAGESADAGQLTAVDLETARLTYHVRWLLKDNFRLERIPGFRRWLSEHFHQVTLLGGGAAVYEVNGLT